MAMRVRIRPPKIRPSFIIPRRYEIVVGIPTYNEAENIESITKIVDGGLAKFFPDKKALIINVDSNSTDRTKKIFLSAKTKTPKQYLKSPRGKGAALKHLFEHFLGMEGAEILMLIDGNVIGVSPRWIRNLILPITKGFDHVFPKYNGHEYDASITNHFCYPVMRGVLGFDLRYPIAGETAMSRKAVDRLFSRDWPSSANNFGIDIMPAISSVFGELRIAEAYLGDCSNKANTEKLAERFEDRASTFLEKLDNNVHQWRREVKTRKPPVFFKGNRKSKFPSIEIDYKAMNERAVEEFSKYKSDINRIVGPELFKKFNAMFKPRVKLDISDNDWVGIIYKFIKSPKISPSKRAKALRPFYFGRFATFYRDNLDKSHSVSERAVVEQAELFFQRRGELIG